MLLGWWALHSMSALNLDRLPRGYEIGLDPAGVGVLLGLVLLVGVLLGLAPVLRLRRMNLNLELREETRGGTAGRRATLVRNLLATMQVAIALVLLSGAGLLLVSFPAVMHLALGFEPARVMTASINLPSPAYKEDPALIAFEQRALQAVRALPEVEAAGLTTAVPFSGNVNNSVIMAEGYVMKPGAAARAHDGHRLVGLLRGDGRAVGGGTVLRRSGHCGRAESGHHRRPAREDVLARSGGTGTPATGRAIRRT